MANDEPQEKTTGGNGAKASATPKPPTKYVALVERDGGLLELVKVGGSPALFEGRRPDVLQEIIDGNYGVEADEKTGVTPYVWIAPARSFGRMRGRVKVERSVTVE